jgi:hypothetical protein
MEMALRTARKLVVLMVREFQPYGATWAELKDKSGIPPTSYKRAFNWAMGRKWFVGGGKQGAPYYLNPDGCWRAALGPAQSGPSSGLVRTLGEVDSRLTTMSEAIQHVDQKKI